LRALAGDDPRITFQGAFDHERLGQILAGIDVLCVPSVWYENTPMVIYEGQAAGCAIIATDLPGMAEVVRVEIDGLLFERGNAAALAGRLLRLAGNRELAGKLAGNAPMPLSVEGHVDRLETLYREHSERSRISRTK
jgi:glycosyltransferase involved in cell wall biosynthesis